MRIILNISKMTIIKYRYREIAHSVTSESPSIHTFLFICKSCVFLKTHLYVKYGYERKFNVFIGKVRIICMK